MKEPKKIPLSDNPRIKEPSKIRLDTIHNNLWEVIDTKYSPPILAKSNENHLENNSQSIQELETDQTN